MVLLLLVLAMAATRFSHPVNGWLPPDASWAVFFITGFHFARTWRWALGLLLIEAVVVDYTAIRYFGVSNYCLTVAYWFIVPAYAVLWLGGAWLRQHYRQAPVDLLRLVASLIVSVTVCFLLTQGGFYWLGGRIVHPDFAGWWSNFTRWYGPFLIVPSVYVALATFIEAVVGSRSPTRTVLGPQPPRWWRRSRHRRSLRSFRPESAPLALQIRQ
jgi:hypothetical protein